MAETQDTAALPSGLMPVGSMEAPAGTMPVGSMEAPPQPQTPAGAAPTADTKSAPTAAPAGKSFGEQAADAGESVLLGAAQSVFETKDFFLGEVPREQKSPMRSAMEDRNKQLKSESMVNAFASGVSQFATGLLGAGKVTKVLGVAGKVAGMGRGAKAALEVGKAAAVGAVAMDPHEERLSNLVQQFPALQNPITGYLASDPSDSRAEGRLKNAMESIGMDLALIGVIAGGAKLLKGLKSGDQSLIAAGTKEIELGQGKMAKSEVDAVEAALPRDPAVQENATGLNPKTGETTSLTPSPTAAAAEDGIALPAAKVPLVGVEDVDPNALLKSARDDALAVDRFGSREAAINAGHRFSREAIPWQKIDANPAAPQGADTFLLDRLAKSRKEELDAIKGGDILSDKSVDRTIRAIAKGFNEDPAAITGMIVRAGDAAADMVATMDSAFYLASRASQDIYTMAARIDAGELSAWKGNRAAADQALKDMLADTATQLGNAQSILSNSARALRRARSDFRLTPEMMEKFQSMDASMLAKMLAETGGDPALMNKVLAPTMVDRIRDGAQFLYVNNLLWGWKTHFINLSTNLYQVGGRPLERIIGSFGVGAQEGARIRAENYKQFVYMGASLSDAFRAAVQTFKHGDSVLVPHTQEAMNMGGSAGRYVAQLPWKDFSSVGNIMHNAMVFGVKSIGAPTRMLGTVDELVKQTVYRSKVQAAAHVEGIESGLKGQDLTDYVRSRLLGSFDDEGRALDTKALQEALVATFQQELLPNTLGKTISTTTANHPWLKFVLPFVRTPTNVLRLGVKLTPGLNMAQQEYRAMILGKMGPEMQAQAVGQMSMGALFMGVAGMLAYSGSITGGGPSDRQAREQLQSTGWQPYSFVTRGPKGEKTYTPYGRFDPISMPFGVIADLVDALAATDGDDDMADKVSDAAMGLLIGLSKQMTNKTYLLSINQVVDAIMDPDKNAAKTSGTMASNFIPFASGLRAVNSDPYLRDARTFTDKLLTTVPGLSETVPAKYDVWGKPIHRHTGLWVNTPDSAVDAELRRMIEDEGLTLGAAPPTRDGVDLREVTMSNGKNAYEEMQKLVNRPTPGTPELKTVIGRLIATKGYQTAPDGAATVKGTKQYILAGRIGDYREAAFKLIQRDKVVREALQEQQRLVQAAYAKNRSQSTGAAAPAQMKQLEDLGASLGVNLDFGTR